MVTLIREAVIPRNCGSVHKFGLLRFQVFAVHLMHQGTPPARRVRLGRVKFGTFRRVFFASLEIDVIDAIVPSHGVVRGDDVTLGDVGIAVDQQDGGEWSTRGTVFMERQHGNVTGQRVEVGRTLVTHDGRM